MNSHQKGMSYGQDVKKGEAVELLPPLTFPGYLEFRLLKWIGLFLFPCWLINFFSFLLNMLHFLCFFHQGGVFKASVYAVINTGKNIICCLQPVNPLGINAVCGNVII